MFPKILFGLISFSFLIFWILIFKQTRDSREISPHGFIIFWIISVITFAGIIFSGFLIFFVEKSAPTTYPNF